MNGTTSTSNLRIDRSVFGDPTWWSWIVMIALLVARFVAGSVGPAIAALALCLAIAAIDIIVRRGDIKAMSVQIRLGYAVLLLVGLVPGMQWMHAVQIAGTTARVLTGYCLLQRELLLFPFNRGGPLTRAFVRSILFAPPGPGGVFRFGSDAPELPNPCGLAV